MAELGILLLLLCPLHSSVRRTISESQQIVDGGLSSVCLGLDNCQLADTQHPVPTVLVSCFQMQHILGIIPHTAVRFPKGWEAILTPPFSEPPYRLLIRPFSTLTKQIIGLQGKTGVITNPCQAKEAQLRILVLTTAHLNLIWDEFQYYCESQCRAWGKDRSLCLYGIHICKKAAVPL